MSKNKIKEPKTYFDRVHKWGRISSVTALIVLFMFPIAIMMYLDAAPDFKAVLTGASKLMLMYWPLAVIEVMVYTPMLGAGGTYLSFVTGNIANLKLPCAINAMEGVGVKANSEEGEVVSTISIAVSSIVTTVVLAIGIIAFAPFLETFTNSALLMPAFKQVLPALFGALGAGYFFKHWKLSVFPIVIMLIVLIFSGSMGASTLLFVGIVASVGGSLFMYKKNWI